MARTLDIFGLPGRPIRRVVVIGCGNIGTAVARVLDEAPEVTLRIIEGDFDRAEAAGATVVERPVTRPGGHLATFADPDGHLWQVIHEPAGSGQS